jgi:hypothetical protein
MTGLTARGESGRDVVGITGFSEVFLVAGKAVNSGGSESLLSVAVGAVQGTMNALAAESRLSLMVPAVGGDGFPVLGGMAVAAVRTQPELVAVVLSFLPMTAFAGGRRPLEDQVRVAIPASHRPVPAEERKSRRVVTLDGEGTDLGLERSGGRPILDGRGEDDQG